MYAAIMVGGMSDKYILITRPQARAQEFQVALGSAVKTLACPLISIEPLEFEIPDVSDFSGFIFTSGYGVEIWAGRVKDREIPVFTVGRQTQEKARAAGFKNVQSAHGTAEDLMVLIKQYHHHEKPLLYLRGQHVTRDLSADLYVRDLCVYTAVSVKTLPNDVVARFKNKDIGAVTLFSKRTARIFLGLVQKYNLMKDIKDVKFLCIGPSVLKCVQTYGFDLNTYSADRPDRDHMIELIYNEMDH